MDVRKSCVSVLLNRNAYAPGETVEGLVCLNLLHTVESRGLFIKLKVGVLGGSLAALC